jgi:hypothetical protein
MESFMTIDSNCRFFEQIGFYFTNNICQKIHKKDKIDKDLEILSDNLSEISLSINYIKACKKYSYKNRGKNIIKHKKKFQILTKFSTIDNNYFEFNFKENKFKFSIETIGDPIGTQDSIITFQAIKIYYTELSNLFDLYKNISNYYLKYYKDTEENDNTYTLYINDECYWDQLGSKNKRDINNIFLPKKLKSSIVDDLGNFLSDDIKKRYNELGINYKRVYLLEGLPGSGKTSLITALASKYDLNIGIFNFDAKTTDSTFSKMVKILPDNCILLLEDMDGLFQARKEGDINKNAVTFSGILNTLDGVATKPGLICFITTNHKTHLDPALIRPGRVDYIMTFEHIKKDEIKQMFKVFMKNTDISNNDEIFYEKIRELQLQISASLLQQYLFKYLDNVEGAIENIEEIKDMYDKSNVKTAKNLYT